MSEVAYINDHPKFHRRRSVRAATLSKPQQVQAWTDYCDREGIDQTKMTTEEADEVFVRYMIEALNGPLVRR